MLKCNSDEVHTWDTVYHVMSSKTQYSKKLFHLFLLLMICFTFIMFLCLKTLSRREWGDSQELLDMVIRWNKIKALVLNCDCCFSSVIYFLDGHEDKMPHVYCFVALCYVSLLRDSMCRNCLAFVLMYKLLPLLDVARAKLPIDIYFFPWYLSFFSWLKTMYEQWFFRQIMVFNSH